LIDRKGNFLPWLYPKEAWTSANQVNPLVIFFP
jgi:hypothetical protein